MQQQEQVASAALVPERVDIPDLEDRDRGRPATMHRLPVSPALIPGTLRRLGYFQNWPEDSLEALAAHAKLVQLDKHGVLASKNEYLDSLYVVVSGLIRVYIPLPNNMERVISLIGPGEGLGEACLILEEPCPFAAVAGKDSHLLVIDAMLFRREIGRDITLARQTLERVSRRFMDTVRDTEICAQRSSVLRVASYLLLHRPGQDALAFTFHLPARKQDVAAKLGLSQETFSRVLSFLDKQGLIQVHGSEIRVENAGRLAEINSMKDCRDPCQEEAKLN